MVQSWNFEFVTKRRARCPREQSREIPRDVTVDATIEVCEKILPGFGELMRSVSLKYVPTAILSRQTAGVVSTH